tara:strand:+ start:142 stop:1191 length:1050 start_codon:yes stop_codon:yes gene_type:complete
MKKLSLYIFLVLMWCNTAQALMPCEGDDYKKWNNCDGSFTYEDGRKYSGEWQNGKKEGIGQQSFSDGFKIIAEFNNNGSPNGYGIGYLPSGEIHVGMFLNGQKFSYGITILKSGNIVMGEFPNGYANYIKLNGEPTYINLKNNKIVEYTNPLPDCIGKYISPTESTHWNNCKGKANLIEAGMIYNTEWSKGKPTGKGSLLILKDGRFGKQFPGRVGNYVGEFKITKDWGEMWGLGVNLWKNGDVYAGEFKKGFYNGKGILRWHQGEIYIGDFVNGKRHGTGSYIYLDGTGYTGEWKNSKMDGFGTETFPDGKRYVGEFKDDKQHGEGICYTKKYGAMNCKMDKGIWIKE